MGLKLGAWTRWSGVIGGAAILFAAGCDRRDERVENARELVRASVEQVTGEDVAPVTAAAAMERASLAQRALAPGRSEIERAGARSRFVIGSVIAKPKEITETRARLAQPQFRNLESIDAEDAAGGEEESASETAPIRRRVTRKELRELRKDRLEQWEIDVQLDAQSKMREAMAKFGIGGEIYTSRDGHMTIDFVEPTQLRERIDRDELWTKRPSLERIKPKRLEAVIARRKRWADYTERTCPENPSPNAMQDDRALATYCLVKALRASDEFEYVEEDFMFDHQFARRPVNEPPATVAPNDPLWSLQWHFQSNGDGEDQSKGGAGFVDFWTKRGEQGSDDVVVAVVDTGLELDHPDILTSPNVANGWDMVSDPVIGNDGDGRDSNPDDPGDICDPDDPFAENSFHGTHVAGTIGAAATDNAAGVAGGAWNVTIVPVRALGKCGGKLSDINDAIRWAGGLIPAEDPVRGEVWNENPADIINLSIGLFEYCPASLQDAIDAVTARGAVVVAAAGNARVSTAFYAPAGCNNVITAAAGDARGVLAPYSNFGAEVDVLAPGGDLDRDDNNDGRPDGVLSTKSAANCFDPLTNEGVDTCYYAYEHGTSMAAPHVSAALALIKADDPGLTGPEMTARLLSAVRSTAPEQCMRPCVETSGPPVEGSANMCLAPCGQGLLDLGRLTD